ncbi:MAG: hypothetical protein KF902_15225 [Phycisphaeraceae bacterium]|nr:hypothetical protein [Phycisphaeraceae bacterium]
MGIFDRFRRQNKAIELLRVRVKSDHSGTMWVEFEPQRADLQDAEYLFLPLCYTGKVLFNFDPRDSSMQLAASMLIRLLRRCLDAGLDSGTNLFEHCELDDVVQYSRMPGQRLVWEADIRLSWTGITNRGIKTHFPLSTTTQLSVFSVIAILQACLHAMDEAGQSLCHDAFEFLVAQYESGADYSDPIVGQSLPRLAYMHAISG